MNEAQLEEAKRLLIEFFDRAFEPGSVEDPFEDLSHIDLAFTTTEDEESLIQSVLDLQGCRLLTYVGDTLVREQQYTPEDLLEDIPYFDYDDLVSVSDEEIEELDKRLSEAFERSISEGAPLSYEPLQGREKQ